MTDRDINSLENSFGELFGNPAMKQPAYVPNEDEMIERMNGIEKTLKTLIDLKHILRTQRQIECLVVCLDVTHPSYASDMYFLAYCYERAQKLKLAMQDDKYSGISNTARRAKKLDYIRQITGLKFHSFKEAREWAQANTFDEKWLGTGSFPDETGQKASIIQELLGMEIEMIEREYWRELS